MDMLYKNGAIYLADMPTVIATDVHKKRPVIILKTISEDMVLVAPLSSKRPSNSKATVTINLYLQDRESYVTILLDRISIISPKRLSTQVGEVNEDIKQKISQILLSQKGMLSDTEADNQKVVQETGTDNQEVKTDEKWGANIDANYWGEMENIL